jgi:uncharacterized membrane protein HdeD (DUF308 family)
MDPGARWARVRLALGLVALGAGVAVLVGPEPAVRIAGTLFGLHLMIAGLVRTALQPAATMYPLGRRVTAGFLGVLTVALGVVCLRHVRLSALLLVLATGGRWLVDGAPALVAGVAGPDPLRGWRFGVGVAAALGAAGILLWPALTRDDAVAMTAGFVVVIALIETGGAVAVLRARRAR